jgi:hypothetical protein
MTASLSRRDESAAEQWLERYVEEHSLLTERLQQLVAGVEDSTTQHLLNAEVAYSLYNVAIVCETFCREITGNAAARDAARRDATRFYRMCITRSVQAFGEDSELATKAIHQLSGLATFSVSNAK